MYSTRAIKQRNLKNNGDKIYFIRMASNGRFHCVAKSAAA